MIKENLIKSMSKSSISLIVPLYNEVENIPKLLESLKKILEPLDYPWEVILVNDGSTDQSEELLNKLLKAYPNFTALHFKRNFGQTAAWAAGFDYAKGDILITLDGDLQNDPADIPRMLAIMEKEGVEVVAGWREHRQDESLRMGLSFIANRIINKTLKTQVKDSGCSLRLIKRSALKGITLYGEMHRLFPFLLVQNGASIAQTPVNHSPRLAGKSKYGFNRTIKVLLDMVTVLFLTQYQTKPMYMFGSVGFGFMGLSLLSAVVIILRRIIWQGEWISPLLFVMTTFFSVGITCILMGLLAEIQVRGWFESSGKKSYVLKDSN